MMAMKKKCPLGSVYLSGLLRQYVYLLRFCGSEGSGTMLSALINLPIEAS
jgi:hypothetical protein